MIKHGIYFANEGMMRTFDLFGDAEHDENVRKQVIQHLIMMHNLGQPTRPSLAHPSRGGAAASP